MSSRSSTPYTMINFFRLATATSLSVAVFSFSSLCVIFLPILFRLVLLYLLVAIIIILDETAFHFGAVDALLVLS